MGPKKVGKVFDDNPWRTLIEENALDEEIWKVKVVMIEAAGSDQDRIYLNKFETFAAEEKRFVIKNICKSETVFMINQLGGEKKVKDDNLRVFEEGQAFLRDKKNIPSDIMALIIKHLIIKIKEEYLFIKRQRLEVREGMRRESFTMANKAEVRGTVNVPPPAPAEPPPPPPKTKGKKSEEVESAVPQPEEGKKYNTLLRIRGEEWRDKVYVDDFPTDGPNIYVAVTGFVDPQLPSELVKIGIPLTAIVQVRIDPLVTKVPSTLFRATKRGQSQTEILTEMSFKFWEDLQLLRINKNSADYFKNTAFILFTPPYWDSESLSGNPTKIYDELCFLMYDVQDLTRQHLHYLDNLYTIHVPEAKNEELFEKYYHHQIDDIPLECATTYSILDSILQTVCKSEELQDTRSKTSVSTISTLNQPRKSVSDEAKVEKADTFVKEVFNTLCKTEANRKAYRLTYGEEYEDHKDPIVINYGDIAKYSTFHLGNINLDSIVWNSLFSMPLHKLWINQERPQGEQEAKINFHVNILLSCFQREDVETSELNRLIHILACRKLYNNRSSLKKKHLASSTISDFKKTYLKRSVLAEPLMAVGSQQKSFGSTPSFPSMTRSENISPDDASLGEDEENDRIKLLFDCPDISGLVSAAELANGAPLNHMIDDFEYFEDFTGVSAFQTMRDAFSKFNCVNYKYCEVTDCFLLMFFNSHDSDGISREEWHCHLATPLCLQDFFDYVLEEHYDWIKNEEKMYDEAVQLKEQSVYKVIIDPNAHQSCVGDVEVDMDLLMEGSIKFNELNIVEEEEQDTDQIKAQHSVSQKSNQSVMSSDGDSKTFRKAKSAGSHKHPQTFMAVSTDSEASIEIPIYPFIGYDLGDRRVEVFGKDETYFARDGTYVHSMYTLIIPINIEYVILSVTPGNNCNEFWMHRALGDNLTPDTINSCESFRITSKDQVMMNIKKQTYQIPLPPVSASTDGIQQLFETKTYHSFFVTWPNGLITESVHENNSHFISHIKQYYVSPKNLNEEKRCVSLKGEVLIFRPSGDIEVLRPDGSFIKITKCYKTLVIREPSEQTQDTSIISSDKSKKGKAKEKLKDKRSKTMIDGDKEEEGKQSQYKLVIEEFEFIETTGLRQKWIHDCPFTVEKLLIRTATDFSLGEVFSRRMDGTHILMKKDGVQVVTFPNGTRIITQFIEEEDEIFPEWTYEEKIYFDMLDTDTMETATTKSKASVSQKSYLISQMSSSSSTKKAETTDVDFEEETVNNMWRRIDGYVSVQIIYTVEHSNFSTITINKVNDKITVDSPNNTSMVVDSNNNYDITLDNATSATFNGENLHIHYEACPECQALTSCDIKIKSDEMCTTPKIQQPWLKMKDSFSTAISVNEEGGINLDLDSDDTVVVHSEEMFDGNDKVEETADNMQERQADRKSESSIISHGKCRQMYHAKALRFFVLRRELTCAELVHRSLLDQYKRDCRWQPWCSINHYDTFGDQRRFLSILTPVHVTESEKWLLDSKLSGKPKYMTYKDLKKDSGKGFYHWMRPYKRYEPQFSKPDNVLPVRLPKAFMLRTLEQQWNEADRDIYKGAKELLHAILRYRHIMESDCETLLHVPVIDLRPEEERRIDEVVQALAHRIYEDLKFRLNEDVQSRARADITTRPPPVEKEESLEGEGEEETIEELKPLEDDCHSQVKQLEDAEEMSSNLKRYWRRRNEELKEEQFYLLLLREGSVPPYFRNVLGGAIWWDINNLTDEAATKAERRKMKCMCAAEECATEH